MTMEIFRRVPFRHENRSYEIRIMFESNIFTVAAFYNNHPANGFRHRLMIPKHADPERVMATGVIDDLVAWAQNDIVAGRWERLAVVWNK